MKASTKKLNIAIVSDAIYPYNIGGKEKRIYELSTRLVKKGHTVTIYTMKWWKGKENSVVHEGVTHEAISPYYPLYSGERRSIKEAIMFALHTLKLLNKKFEILEVDHMPHLILFPIKIVTILKRKKLFVTWNEVWGRKYWVEYLGFAGNIAYIIELLSVKTPDEIISISPHTTKKLKQELKVHKPIHTIPMGIDLKAISNIKPSKEKSDLLFAGRLLEHKNVSHIIKAVDILKKKFPNIKCIIVGKGPEERNLKKLVNTLKLTKNIIFYTFLKNQDDLYALMKSSKVFLFPSTREGFGIVALEANAASIPVITTNHKDNATKELINNGKNGFIVDLDEIIIAEKTNFLLQNKLKPFGTLIKKYDWDNLATETEREYLL